MPPPPNKKRKRANDPAHFKETRQKIRTLEASLSDKANLNNIVQLIDLTKKHLDEDPQVVHAAIHALHRVFTRWQMNGDLDTTRHQQSNAAAAKVTSWLNTQLDTYLNMLRQLLVHDEPGLQLPALQIQMTFIKSHSEYRKAQGKDYEFANYIFKPLVKAVITNDNLSEQLQKEFVQKYVNAYDDIRYYFYQDAAGIMKDITEKKKNALGAIVAKNTFGILEGIRSMPTEPEEINEFWTAHPNPHAQGNKKDGDDMMDQDDEDALLLGDEGLVSDNEEDDTKKPHSKLSKKERNSKPFLLHLNAHKRAFQNGWLAFLGLPLTEELYKKTLLMLHKRILLHLFEPKLLMDFLTDSYNVGGAVSLLALNGLFILITEHNLDYPDFYHKLYTLLDRNIMHVKYRSRFFRLLDIFLSSSLLPAALIAAFIKRLARLSLTAPPAASVTIVPFIYNLLRRHPTCMKLIHSNDAVGKADDPFDFDEKNPYECHALESSLWEVQTLAQHYYANVSTLAKIFSEKFLKPKYNLEDFMDHTYATFFKNEIGRKRKREPAMAFEKPSENEWEI